MKNSKKIITIVIACISIMMMIAGCSPRRTGNRIMNTGTGNNTTNQIGRTTTKSTNMIYSNTLSSLVKAGTITKAQSDRVLAALTTNNNGAVSLNQGLNSTGNYNQGNGIANPSQANSVTGAPTNTGIGTGNNINSGTGNSLNNGNGTGLGNEIGIRTPMGVGTRMDNTIGNGSLTDNRTRTGTGNAIGTTPRTGRELGIGNAEGEGTGVGMGSGTDPKTKTGTINRTGLGTSINDGPMTSQSISGTGNQNANITNKLSGLVSSGVITQSQANIINKKITEAIKNNQNK